MQSDTCQWHGDNELMKKYHDEEWGVPLHDDNKLFEFLLLDTFQAGLSWSIILKKREGFRIAFSNFNPELIAKYNEENIAALLDNSDIIRNKLKINATISNARCFLEVQKEFGTFDRYIWQFTSGRTIKNKFKESRDIPVKTPESDAMSKDLINRGFKFVGSTICYAFMQAAGMVNDHLVRCYRYNKV